MSRTRRFEREDEDEQDDALSYGPYNPEEGETDDRFVRDMPLADDPEYGAHNPSFEQTAMAQPEVEGPETGAMDPTFEQSFFARRTPQPDTSGTVAHNPRQGTVSIPRQTPVAPPAPVAQPAQQALSEQELALNPEAGDVPGNFPVKNPQGGSGVPFVTAQTQAKPAEPATPMPAKPRQVLGDTRKVQAPITAPSVQKAPVQVSKVDAGPKPRGTLASAARTLPNILANAFAASKAGDVGREAQPILSGINNRVQNNRDMRDSDEAARQKYGQRVGALKRSAATEAKEDARYEAGVSRADAKEKRLLNKEERQANDAKILSAKRSKTLQAAFRTAYPEVAAQMSAEDLANITEDDMGAVGLMTEQPKLKAKSAAETATRQTVRGEKLEDLEKSEGIKKRFRQGATSSYASPQTPEERAAGDKAVWDALATKFGGADKIDPVLSQRVRMAQAIRNPGKRAAAVDRVMTAAMSEARKDDTDAEGDAQADLKENKAYLDATERPRAALAAISQLEKTLGVRSEDPVKDADKDIPGVGPIENNVPNIAYATAAMFGHDRSAKALQVRADTRRLVAEEAKRLTGLAATAEQYKKLDSIVGAADSMDDAQLREAMKVIKAEAMDIQARASRAYPNAARQYNTTEANAPIPNPGSAQPMPKTAPAQGQPAPGGTVKVRDKAGNVKDKVDSPKLREMVAQGLIEIVQ